MEPGEFEGTVGRWHWESEQWWPDPVRPPDGAPNVLLVLLDDVGYAQLGPYGSDIDTPTFDRLAAGGLTFTNFHTTALCSPTRACVLTGRNHHAVGMGRITDLATGFPGYDATISATNAFLPEMLVPHGWAAYGSGKWHLTPRDEQHLGADRRTWPLRRGFERYYGFFDGETHQFAPTLFHDSHQVAPPGGHADGYHLTDDLADRLVEFVTDLRNGDPDKPFFAYFAPGACHSPHHAPDRWLQHYRGRFDAGWDKWRDATFARQLERGLLPPSTELSPRPDWVPAWDELSDDQRRVSARYMEAFAAMLSHTDEQLGRVLDFLEHIGDLDNTMVLVMSDNGASSEGGPGGSNNDSRPWNVLGTTLDEQVEHIDAIGGPTIHNNYPWGWTVAGNTPFRRWKREVHEGGVADPLLVHWPRRIGDRGSVRHQYCHAIDVAPTILAACGVDAPSQLDGRQLQPVQGTSLLAVIDDADHPEVRTTQYYEMFGCRALYDQGWKAVTYHPIQDDRPGLDDERWELYEVTTDPSECHDRAADEPERLQAMIERWWAEAEANQVLPVDNRPFSQFAIDRPRPDRPSFVFWPGGGMVPEETAADIKNRTHRVVAEIEHDIDDGAPTGVLVSQGSGLGGWVLFCDHDGLHWHVNVSSARHTRVSAPLALGPGSHRLEMRFTKTAEFRGQAALLIDGQQAASAVVEYFTPTRFSITGAGLTVGRADPYPVCDDDAASRPWSGHIDNVMIEVDGPAHIDPEAEAQTAIAAQ
ncbi:MAG: sulfatase-like hydrolase/transferase [Acidimicrobiia bacterium]|nr:sulfatase-like hydrolase/transferase [Acidimicrobiia bacterium]